MFKNRSERSIPSHELDSETFVHYKDVAEPEEEAPRLDCSNSELPLPGYEPMHDYLRRQHALFKPTILTQATPMSIPTTRLIQQGPTAHSISPPPSLSLSLSSSSSSSHSYEPFLINISDVSTPPPSYDNINRSQNETEMRTFWVITGDLQEETSMEEQEEEDDDNLPIEDLVKWVVVMLMISLTIAFIGTLLDWGRV